MTDYRQKYENERTARKLAEKEVELLKKEVELLKMELKQASRKRSPQFSKEESDSDLFSSSSSESEEEPEQPLVFKKVIRKKSPTSSSGHGIKFNDVGHTLKEVICDFVDNMTFNDICTYATSMEENNKYEVNIFESIMSSIEKSQQPIIFNNGQYSVFDNEKEGRIWTTCDTNKIVSKTFERLYNEILRAFNTKFYTNITGKKEHDQTYLMEVLNQLCKIDVAQYLTKRSKAIATMFKN